MFGYELVMKLEQEERERELSRHWRHFRDDPEQTERRTERRTMCRQVTGLMSFLGRRVTPLHEPPWERNAAHPARQRGRWEPLEVKARPQQE